MIVTNRGQQQCVTFHVDTDRCCGCKHCIRRCMENVWAWDEEKGFAFPKYPDECVMCLQCEMECLNNCIDIEMTETILVDPLEYSAGLIDPESVKREVQ